MGPTVLACRGRYALGPYNTVDPGGEPPGVSACSGATEDHI